MLSSAIRLRAPAFFDAVARYALIALAFTPLITFRTSLVYPYTFSKALFFRAVLELIVAILAVRLAFLPGGEEVISEWKTKVRQLLREPLFLALLAFLASAFLSTLLAENMSQAFWGNAERGDGFFSLLHYGFFIVLVVILFKRGDWRLFFRVALVTGFLMAAYAWLQWFGIQGIPFALSPSGRPGSFLNNPAFFASYLIFVIALALVVSRYEKEKTPWRYAAFVVAFLSFLTIFLTNVRGAAIGVLGGVVCILLFFALRRGGVQTNRSRTLARIGLLAVVIFGTVFWTTRENTIWREVPMLGRIATFGGEDRSLQTRLNSLGASWGAFLERPLFGWGMENFNVGYNKHFNSDFFLYEDAWFDRAHNKIAELAVTQGLVGVLLYLILFCVLGISLFRRSTDERFSAAAPFLAAGLLAYFLQNLFLFDDPISYFMFASVFGFVLSIRASSVAIPVVETGRMTYPHALRVGTALGFAIVSLIVVYVWVVIPFAQSRYFYQGIQSRVGTRILDYAPFFLRPYNFLQQTLRFRLVEILLTENLLRDKQFDALSIVALRALEETAEKDSNYEPRYLEGLAKAYNEKGKDVPEFFNKAEGYARRAILLSPTRQTLYYPLSFALAGQNRFAEAIEIARGAVSLSPRVAKAHYNLGLMLALAGNEHWDEALAEFKSALELQPTSLYLGSLDIKNLTIIYKEMIVAHVRNQDRERIVELVERYGEVEPGVEKDLMLIRRLAEDGDWQTLEQAVNLGRGR